VGYEEIIEGAGRKTQKEGKFQGLTEIKFSYGKREKRNSED
jgi:hypothetical protein